MLIGIDLGSRNVKIIQIIDGKVTGRFIADTIEFYRHNKLSDRGYLDFRVREFGFSEDQIAATGYGKVSVPVQNAIQVPEIQAHVYGAVYQSKLSDFTLLDIGGQDTKVVKVRDGQAVDFLTNDRCAASSGRYMENMAGVLGVTLAELGSHYENPVELNATCAIFGETEIIARIVEGYSTAQLSAGVNYALYKRFSSMLNKMVSPDIVLAGGAAHNSALRQIIIAETRCQVHVLPEPQFNGAIGCSIYVQESGLV